jgi:lambda family phage minor tail protein L
LTALTEAAQSLSPIRGGLVTLYELDARTLGDTDIRRFTRDTMPDGSTIVFNANQYVPIDIEAEGFEWGGSGAPPTPTLKISNVSLYAGVLVREFDDLCGALLTRIRTYRDFLDAGASPDPTLMFPIDVFRVERKVSHNKVFIEFELAVIFDQEGLKLPNRQCIRDTCTHIYRRYDQQTDSFDYSKATCPYTGTAYFKRDGAATTLKSEDVCGKRLSNCVARFGDDATLPTRAFPGMQRYST